MIGWHRLTQALIKTALSECRSGQGNITSFHIYNQPCVWGAIPRWNYPPRPADWTTFRGNRKKKKNRRHPITVSSFQLMDYYHRCHYLLKIQARQCPKTQWQPCWHNTGGNRKFISVTSTAKRGHPFRFIQAVIYNNLTLRFSKWGGRPPNRFQVSFSKWKREKKEICVIWFQRELSSFKESSCLERFYLFGALRLF